MPYEAPNTRQYLADSPNLHVVRIDGGWIVVLPEADVPLACRVAADVLACVFEYLGAWPVIDWEERPGGDSQGSLLLSKIDGGYMLSMPVGSVGPGMLHATPQSVRFAERDVVLSVGEWLGLQDSSQHRRSSMTYFTLIKNDADMTLVFDDGAPYDNDQRTAIANGIAPLVGATTVEQADDLTFILTR